MSETTEAAQPPAVPASGEELDGHLIGPGHPRYREAVQAQAEGCGWPGPQRPGQEPDGG